MNKAERLLTGFLEEHECGLRDFVNLPLEETGLLSEGAGELELTHFNDLYDTLLYSHLIHEGINLSPQIEQVIDLGAGSSIPTLLALKKVGHRDLQVKAVDLDPEAIEVSRKNALKLGMLDSYSFHQGNMRSLLTELELTPQTLVVSNPPYIPVPHGMDEHHLIPVNGGDDGSLYLENLLNQCHSSGATLALLWGSLTNPLKIIPLIEEKYEILHLEAARVHFGNYTSLPKIRSHLYQLREEGKVVFENTQDQGEVQLVIGAVMKSKLHRQ